VNRKRVALRVASLHSFAQIRDKAIRRSLPRLVDSHRNDEAMAVCRVCAPHLTAAVKYEKWSSFRIPRLALPAGRFCLGTLDKHDLIRRDR
jgi:hypothetical protein